MIRVTGYPSLREGLEYLKNYVVEAEARGEKTVVFCEDRLTLLAEQTICEGVGGTFLTSVTTFARFLRVEGRTLSKQGSVMVIGKILAEHAGELKCFSSRSGAVNGAAAVYEMISQLAASKVTPEMLGCEEIEEGLLKDKLKDLSVVYALYEDFLRENGYVDENGYLALLPEAIARDADMAGANAVFLGFCSFTSQALDGVRAAIGRAKNVVGILPAGKGEFYSLQAVAAFKRVCLECGETVSAQIRVSEERAGAAEILRERLYRPEVFSERYASLESGGKVRVLAAKDPEDELRFVCARVKKHLAEGGRYRDVCVFVPDVNAYALLISKVFGEYGIPFFADYKKPLSSHPFARFLFALLHASADGYQPTTVARVASSPYFGDDGAYRNYLAKFCNYRGGAKREIKTGAIIKDYDEEYLGQMRLRLLSGVGAFPRKATGRDYCKAARAVYETFDVREGTKRLAEACGDKLQAEYLLKMDDALEGVLRESEELLGDTVISATEFSDVLENGLSACEISLLPLQCDAVFAGDVTESRISEAKIIFALGMSEDVPFHGEDTALLSDRDMERLEGVKVKIEPSVAQVNARAKENVCLNLCSFTDRLFLLYPAGDDERAESEILRYARRIFSDAQEREELFAYRVSEPQPAMRELLLLRDEYLEGKTNDRKKLSSLYAALRSVENEAAMTEELFGGKKADVYLRDGERLFFSGGEVSPTLLEGYYACPYKNFTERGLKLKEREETTVMATDTGTFVHGVLEAVAKRAEEFADEEECYAFALAEAEKMLKTPLFGSLKDTAAGAYAGTRLTGECAAIAREMYRQIKNSNFRVKYTEYVCRLPEEKLRGKIDRVDECGEYVRIVDYKTGKTDDSAAAYYSGRKLQLQLYMSAVSAGKIPAGVYYFPAVYEYRKEDESPFRMSGFTNGAEEVIRNSDLTLKEGEKSRFINASLGGRNTDKTMEEEDFRRFIAYSVLSGRRGAAEMKRGFIAPSPYAGSCEYCAYKGMCAAIGEAVVRKVSDRITCREIAEIVKRESGEE